MIFIGTLFFTLLEMRIQYTSPNIIFEKCFDKFTFIDKKISENPDIFNMWAMGLTGRLHHL